MRIIIYIFLLFICLNQTTYSSDIDSRYNHFDSLLFEGKLDLLEEALEKSDKTFATYEDSLKQQLRFNKYYRVILYKDNFQNQRQDFLLKYITYKISEKKYFSKSFAGERASVSYDKFLSSIDTKSEIEALKYSFIANYFRDQTIDKAINKQKIIYKQAQEFYNESNYKKSLEYMQANEIDPGNNYILKSYHDSLLTLYNAATIKQKGIEKKEMFWLQKNTLLKNWYLSLGIHSVYQPAQNNIVFDFMDQDPSFLYSNGLVSKQNSAGFSFEVLRKLTERISIGGDIMKLKLTYISDFDMSMIFYDYSYDILSTHVKGRYYLRKFVGLRPYVGIGVGYFRANRSKTEVKVYRFSPAGNIDIYNLSQKTITSMQSKIELGFQFIYNENSDLTFDIKISGYKNHKEDPNIKSHYYSLSTHFGLLL